LPRCLPRAELVLLFLLEDEPYEFIDDPNPRWVGALYELSLEDARAELTDGAEGAPEGAEGADLLVLAAPSFRFAFDSFLTTDLIPSLNLTMSVWLFCAKLSA
jgi:hypothetical protein